jgi:hypothetical protein
VLQNGRITRIDEAAIHAEAQEIVSRLHAGLPGRMRRAAEFQPLFRELERRVSKTELSFSRFCG